MHAARDRAAVFVPRGPRRGQLAALLADVEGEGALMPVARDAAALRCHNPRCVIWIAVARLRVAGIVRSIQLYLLQLPLPAREDGSIVMIIRPPAKVTRKVS
jgi:hypothetical protein